MPFDDEDGFVTGEDMRPERERVMRTIDERCLAHGVVSLADASHFLCVLAAADREALQKNFRHALRLGAVIVESQAGRRWQAPEVPSVAASLAELAQRELGERRADMEAAGRARVRIADSRRAAERRLRSRKQQWFGLPRLFAPGYWESKELKDLARSVRDLADAESDCIQAEQLHAALEHALACHTAGQPFAPADSAAGEQVAELLVAAQAVVDAAAQRDRAFCVLADERSELERREVAVARARDFVGARLDAGVSGDLTIGRRALRDAVLDDSLWRDGATAGKSA